jgi:hypothetical protein
MPAIMPTPSRLKQLIFFILVLSGGAAFSQTDNITVTILSPTTNQVSGASVQVQAKVQSTYQINSVVAAVQGNQLTLTYNASTNSYYGNLPLSGLTTGAKTLTVTATDAYNNVQPASVPIIYHVPPELHIQRPYDYSVVRPTLPVKASCFDSSGSCTITLSIMDGGLNYSGTFNNSVDTVLDLSAYSMRSGLALEIQASNSLGQVSYTTRNIFLEFSPYLQEVYSDTNQIIDFSDNRVLVIKDGTISSPRIVRITDSTSTAIPFLGELSSGGSLTTTGAVFYGRDTAHLITGNGSMYDWNSGTLDSLAVGSFVAKGGYCAYSDAHLFPTNLILRNLVTRADEFLSFRSGTSGFDVAADGALAYIANDTVAILKNGVRTAYLASPAYAYNSPLTDGARVVYESSVSGPIWLWDGTTATQLGSTFQTTPIPGVQPGAGYQVNNGYVAYVSPGTTGQSQIWIRDSTGAAKQATFYSSSSSLGLLNPKGEMTFTTAGNIGLNFYSNNTIVPNICTVFGKAYYQDSAWYYVEGRTLFRININLVPNKADSFALPVQEDSLRTFCTGDFSKHFEGSGVLLSIEIPALPKNGTLKLGSVPVMANQIIAVGQISQLVYTPNTGFTGSDTLVWNGTNGIAYTATNGIVVLSVTSVPGPPPAPVISGLQRGYCQHAGAQTITIANMPQAQSQTTVAAFIDSAAVTVSGGGAFTLQPSVLRSGNHTVAVVFTNADGADTTTEPFLVDSAVTPVVRLSSNVSTVSSSSAPVVLTASNVSGGGMTPLYTFSRDDQFVNLLQPEGTSASVSVNVSSLLVGNNKFFVRMRTSDTCYAVQTGVDSVVVVLQADTGVGPPVTPPGAPQLSGLESAYCGSAAAQTVTITNMPGTGATVRATLDGQAVAVASNGVFSINPSVLAAGAHSLSVIFANSAGADTTVQTFGVYAAATPVVVLGSDLTSVDATVPTVVLTAHAAAGGGPAPQYTFASDSGFAHVLQTEGPSASLTVWVSSLAVGKNTFYVRMATSDSCYTAQTAVASVAVTLVPPASGVHLIDMDNPGQPIFVGPNPFNGSVILEGLMSMKSYSVSLMDGMGQEIVRMQVEGQQQAVLYTDAGKTGVYFLRLYDETKNRVIGYVKLLALGR